MSASELAPVQPPPSTAMLLAVIAEAARDPKVDAASELAPVQPPPSTAMLLAVIAEAARDPKLDAAKMRELWTLKREIDEHDAKVSFYRAMQAVQNESSPIIRDKEVKNNAGEVTNKYARLEMIDKVMRPIYTKHGFSLTFGSREGTAQNSIVITCDVMHRDGHMAHYELPGKLDTPNKVKSEIQAIGSTVTFFRRYLVTLIFNIVFTNDAEFDNDLEGAPDLSEDQLNKLLDLTLDLPEATKQSFLRYMGVESIEKIPARQFTMAVTALQAKRRQQGK